MNPAVCLALLILGKMDGTEFAAAVGGEFLGAFFGAVLVWLHFLPHFKSVPTPPSLTPENILLKAGADAFSPSTLGISSYNPDIEDVKARQRGFGGISHAFQDIKYYLKETYPEPPERHAALVEVALGPQESIVGGNDAFNRLRRRSVQVCDVHRRLKDIDIEEFKSMLVTPELHPASSARNMSMARPSAAFNGNGNAPAGSSPAASAVNLAKSHSASDLSSQAPFTAATGPEDKNNGGAKLSQGGATSVVDKRAEKLDKLYDAAVVADQNAKLSIFATRPAIYSPLLNFLCEIMGTTVSHHVYIYVFKNNHLKLKNSIAFFWGKIIAFLNIYFSLIHQLQFFQISICFL